MQNQLPTLITSNAKTGLDLANELADHLHAQMETAGCKTKRPGGMNYLLPQQMPKEMTASILFYTIAIANHGWAGQKS